MRLISGQLALARLELVWGEFRARVDVQPISLDRVFDRETDRNLRPRSRGRASPPRRLDKRLNARGAKGAGWQIEDRRESTSEIGGNGVHVADTPRVAVARSAPSLDHRADGELATCSRDLGGLAFRFKLGAPDIGLSFKFGDRIEPAGDVASVSFSRPFGSAGV
jgi:hypothetical protein